MPDQIHHKPIILAINLTGNFSKDALYAGKPSLRDYTEHKNVVGHTIPPSDALATANEQVAEDIASIAHTIRQHVKKHGRLDTIRFDAHGDVMSIIHTMKHTENILPVTKVLDTIESVQREFGFPIAAKIEFLNCNIFTNMKPEWVADLRARSTRLGMEIAGEHATGTAKTYEPLISFKDGQVGRFTQGSWNAFAQLVGETTSLYGKLNGKHYSDEWIACHQRKTQEEGAACQKQLAVEDAKSTESLPAPLRSIKQLWKGKPEQER